MPIIAFIEVASLSRMPIRYIDGKPKDQHALRRISTLYAEVGSCGPIERSGLSRDEETATGLADRPCGSSHPVVPVQFGGGWVFNGFGPRKVKVFFGFCD